MFNLLQRAKGLALNKTATTILDFYVKKKNLGELKSFDIEMSTKTLSVSFIPKNFTEALVIEAKNYNIVKDEKLQKNYLTFDSITTSDNWDNSRFNQLIKDKRIEIPEKYSKYIALVV